MATIHAILTDIEGTTSSISFVHKVLFPLSLEKIPGYVQKNGAKKEVAEALNVLWNKIEGKSEAKKEKTLIDTLQDFIRRDVKDTTLKWVQGKIWHDAFVSGEVEGHVYPEVKKFFYKWTSDNLKIYIYSSGSVDAQKDLFKYSQAGDLGVFLSGYFDTTTGMKRDSESYRKIQKAVAVEPSSILFLSDVVEELNAAHEAGMQTCLLLRENVQAPQGFQGKKARDFSEVDSIFF